MSITHRSHIVRLVAPGGTVIELGVAAGRFAVEMLTENPAIHYIGIDRWSDHHDDTERLNAVARITALCPRAEIVKSTFKDALPLFGAPESADLVYLDGYAHTGQEGGETLRDWWPTVKPGGIFAGHDYCAKYQPTIDAVDCFVAERGLELHIIHDGDHPSWWIRKP